MTKKLKYIITKSTDPYHNLALEEALLNSVGEGECILYLWQNARTVVIGRNQCAYAECRIDRLERDGGSLARRLSGGGAVYHDLGNLNFTFITDPEGFDKARQNRVILSAVRRSGIDASISGRNDLTVDGRKFSGHAYYKSGKACYHHGTLMLDVDKDALSEYLSVSPLKLRSKGVGSVRSRIINLSEIKPGISVKELEGNLVSSLSEVCGLSAQRLREEELDSAEIDALAEKYSSAEWKYGDKDTPANTVEKRFDWGQARMDYEIEKGRFSRVRFYSDGLEADYLSGVAGRLEGCGADMVSVKLRLSENAPDEVRGIANDIVSMLGTEVNNEF